LIAIPSGAPWWGVGDWALFAGAVGSTVALSAGRPSLDVRFQDFVEYKLLRPGHFTVWNTAGDLIIWSTAGVATVGLLIYGIVSGHEPSAETAALMIEAFAVAQLYHQMIKLLVGRAPPDAPELEGRYFGPVEAVKFWPGGTPSGHMASMYALLSVLMYSIDEPLLWVGLNAFAFVFGAALVGDNYHWLSDVLLGAGIGFCVGRWVVQHRSTHYVYGADPPPLVRVNLMPLVLPGSGAGVGLVGSF
jgi:membrane-associated phospholipid phosphatase